MNIKLIIALSLLSSVALAENPYAKYGTDPSSRYVEPEITQHYDYNTGAISQSTTTRHSDGTIDIHTYDYGTGNTADYYGDSTGGNWYNYGTGGFESVYGNPYGASEPSNGGALPAFAPMEW